MGCQVSFSLVFRQPWWEEMVGGNVDGDWWCLRVLGWCLINLTVGDFSWSLWWVIGVVHGGQKPPVVVFSGVRWLQHQQHHHSMVVLVLGSEGRKVNSKCEGWVIFGGDFSQ